jgi:hypothetical protein
MPGLVIVSHLLKLAKLLHAVITLAVRTANPAVMSVDYVEEGI